MPRASRHDARGNVDRGTELGTGTRFLTSVFRLPVRATRAIGRAFARLGNVGRRGWSSAAALGVVLGLAAVAVFDSPTTAAGIVVLPVLFVAAIALACAIAVALGAGAVRAAPYVGRAVARVARAFWRAVGPVVRAVVSAIASGVLSVARPLATAIAYVAVHLGRAVAFVAVRVGRGIAYVAARVRRALAFVAVHIGRAIAFVAIRVGHAVAFVAVHIGRAVAFVGVRVGRAVGYIAVRAGRAIRFVAVPIGRAIESAARAFDRAVGIVARSIGHALGVLFAPIGRAITRAASVIQRVVISPIHHAIRAFATALERLAERVGHRVAAFVGLVVNWLRTGMLRIRHSVGVAAARARQTHAALGVAGAPAEPHRAPSPPPPFSAQVFHNEYLPSGSRSVDAVITVTAHAQTEADGPTPTAEVILVDCSGSMGQPWRKIRAARGATVAAINALPDGAYFAVVRANHDADIVYPTHGGLAIKSEQTAAEARRAVQMLWPEGGTAMGRWLLVARELLATAPHAIGHAILLTDGKNESESAEDLATARRACRGRFQCDCRGVGTDWDVAELRGIARELLGTVDIVADPADLAADFQAMAERAAAKRVDGVTLRVWTPIDSTVRFIKQVSPWIEDLGLHPIRVDARTVDYPTGAWSDESRDYHLSIELPVQPTCTEMLAARVSLVVGDRVLSKALVTATWTEDIELSTRIVPEVVHYTGQAELLGAVQEGLERRRAGDEAGALARLGEAARRAYETDNEVTLQLIANVVEIEDAPTGRVCARAVVDDADLIALDTRSTRTKRFASPPDPVPAVSSD
jgi:hypothetical protein